MQKTLIGAAIAATLMASSAHAVTANYDFQAIADGGTFDSTSATGLTGDESSWANVVGAVGDGILDNGISVVGSGLGTDTNGNTSALLGYFDAGSAGLGVCSSLYSSNNECNPANDDNVGSIGGTANATDTSFETLVLTFSTAVGITALNLAGEGHGYFGGTLVINGTTFDSTTAFTGNGNGDFSVLTTAGQTLLSSLGLASVWNFEYVPVGQAAPINEFYIDSMTVSSGAGTLPPVPLPATAPMLLAALGVFGFGARRLKKRSI